jgi:hypothetical protein
VVCRSSDSADPLLEVMLAAERRAPGFIVLLARTIAKFPPPSVRRSSYAAEGSIGSLCLPKTRGGSAE